MVDLEASARPRANCSFIACVASLSGPAGRVPAGCAPDSDTLRGRERRLAGFRGRLTGGRGHARAVIAASHQFTCSSDHIIEQSAKVSE